MQHRNRNRALASLAAVAAVASAGLPAPARATTQYSLAIGGGAESRYMIDSEWNPGTCTINVDWNLAQAHPQLNGVDAVVLTPAQVGAAPGKPVAIAWGATQKLPAGAALVVRVTDGPTDGCRHTDVNITGPNGSFVTTAATQYIVVTAAEGTVAPWFKV